MEPGLIPQDNIQSLIYLVRGLRVMLDSDLARLYCVKTKELNQAVGRNKERFPPDFMFQLSLEEVTNLRFQIGTSSSGYGGRRYLPYAFTEQGVAMLSSVLRSERAVQVNIAIMRVFVRLHESLAAHKELAAKLTELERRVSSHEEGIQALFEAIRQLMNPPLPPAPHRKKIGFKVGEKRPRYGRK